jgi:acyl carrier protein
MRRIKRDCLTIIEEPKKIDVMTENEFLKEIEEILDLKAGTLKGHEKLEDLENWDSTALMSLIGAAESLGNTGITLEQVMSCSTVSDLLRLVPLESPSNRVQLSLQGPGTRD